jgi:two-component sensor histidine kinase
MDAPSHNLNSGSAPSLLRQIVQKALCTPQLPLVVATLIIAMIAIVVGLRIWHDRTRTLDEGRREARNLAQVLEEQASRTIQAVDFTLISIIDLMRLTPSIAEHDPEFEETLRHKLTMLPYVRALFVIGPDGFITQDTDHPKTPRVSLADREYFIAHATDPDVGLYIGRPLVSRSVNVWFVSMSRRLNKPDGSFGGIVVAAVEPRYFEHFYQKLQLSEDDIIALFAREGVLIARHPYRDEAIGKNFANQELFQRYLPANPIGTYQRPSFIDGVSRIISYRSVEGLPLLVVVGIGENALLAGWRRNALTTGFTTTLAMALVLVVTKLAVQRHREVIRLNSSLSQQNHQILARDTEKGVLLREIHHRVKNNLQAMWGMIQVERSRFTDQEARNRLALVADRISVLGRIHQQLYTSGNFAYVNMGEHIDELCRNLAEASGRSELTFQVDVETLLLDLEVALPVGLMVNELVSNSLKHAFPEGRGGQIGVLLHRQSPEQICLSVSDNGVGVDDGDTGSFGIGLTLVQALADQIGGSVRVSAEAGHNVVVSFPSRWTQCGIDPVTR